MADIHGINLKVKEKKADISLRLPKIKYIIRKIKVEKGLAENLSLIMRNLNIHCFAQNFFSLFQFN